MHRRPRRRQLNHSFDTFDLQAKFVSALRVGCWLPVPPDRATDLPWPLPEEQPRIGAVTIAGRFLDRFRVGEPDDERTDARCALWLILEKAAPDSGIPERVRTS